MSGAKPSGAKQRREGTGDLPQGERLRAAEEREPGGLRASIDKGRACNTHSYPFLLLFQDLKARLKEEMGRVQSVVTDQRSEANKDRTCCELEVTCHIHEHTCHESESRKEVHASQHRCMVLQTPEQISCLTDKGWPASTRVCVYL